MGAGFSRSRAASSSNGSRGSASTGRTLAPDMHTWSKGLTKCGSPTPTKATSGSSSPPGYSNRQTSRETSGWDRDRRRTPGFPSLAISAGSSGGQPGWPAAAQRSDLDPAQEERPPRTRKVAGSTPAFCVLPVRESSVAMYSTKPPEMTHAVTSVTMCAGADVLGLGRGQRARRTCWGGDGLGLDGALRGRGGRSP